MFFTPKGEPILAPMSGQIIPISDVNSPIFAGKVVGDGIAIIPVSSEVFAPISGVIAFIGAQKHTLGITGFDGIEVLIHLGIGTVSLNGEGFTQHVKVGQKVSSGELFAHVDWKFIKDRGYDITSPVVITSSSNDKIKRLTLQNGPATAAHTVCMRYVTK